MKTTLAALALLAALGAPAGADRADDDLQAVRRAVAASAGTQARPPAEEPQVTRDEARPAPRKGEPQWFRVRIVERAGRRAKVQVNLPLALVRSFGDDWPLGIDRRGDHEHRHGPTLGEVLRALDSGQSLVEIEDDETTVRVWVE
jgi:hypothetical protein